MYNDMEPALCLCSASFLYSAINLFMFKMEFFDMVCQRPHSFFTFKLILIFLILDFALYGLVKIGRSGLYLCIISSFVLRLVSN